MSDESPQPRGAAAAGRPRRPPPAALRQAPRGGPGGGRPSPWSSASLGFVGFGVAYWVAANTQWEAITLGVGLLALGFGVTAWGKYLMPQGPFVEERHEFHSTEAEREAMTAAITERGGMVVKRRKVLGGLFAAGVDGHGDRAALPPAPVPRPQAGQHRCSRPTGRRAPSW